MVVDLDLNRKSGSKPLLTTLGWEVMRKIMKKTGEEDNKSFSEEVEKIKEEKIKESGWRYTGGNWGWLSLFSVALLFLSIYEVALLGFKMEIGFVFCFSIFMWMGVKELFSLKNHSGP